MVGVIAGTIGAVLATRIQSQLHGITAIDPASFATAPLLVIGATALAAWLPAMRAGRVDPMRALKSN